MYQLIHVVIGKHFDEKPITIKLLHLAQTYRKCHDQEENTLGRKKLKF